MEIQVVAFSEPKDGLAPRDWQDGACGGVVGDAPGRARFIVVDGASTAYDPVHWVDMLVSSFAPGGGRVTGPALDRASMRAWFIQMQDQWATEPRVFGSTIEKEKFDKVGSMATLLAFELSGLDGPEPYWQGVALGDAVLFHVRASRLIAILPKIGVADFGTWPGGVFTKRDRLDWMTAELRGDHGLLEPGDFLFAATDAMAHWILRAIGRDEKKVWHTLANLPHPARFAELVADQRREQDPDKRLHNDDVTLLRVRILADHPSLLLACR
jgi:hypothetical protein